MLAAALDLCALRWEYEPVSFALEWGAGGEVRRELRPDFWLPDQGCFLELTTAEQRLVTRKNAKVRRCRELHPDVAIHVLYQRDFKALLDRLGMEGSPGQAA